MIPPKAQWPNLPKSREAAKATGIQHYFTGQPCVHGHKVPRRTSTGACTTCSRQADQARQARKLESTESTEAYHIAVAKKMRARPSFAPKQRREANQKWAGLRRLPSQLRIDRRPPNQPEKERAAIKALYVKAKADGMVVDHFIPFRHPQIRGLHTLANLRTVTARQNGVKGNRLNLSPRQIGNYIKRGMAVRAEDVDEKTGKVNWSNYPQYEATERHDVTLASTRRKRGRSS